MTKLPVSEPRRIPSLDGLRGLAACIVFVSHTINLTGLWNGLLGTGGGQIGVMLFFVLSGYLMGSLYLDRPFTSENIWNYAVHRIARVVPLFYLVLISAMLIAKVGDMFHIDLSFYAIGNPFHLFIFFRGTDIFWTIPVEIQFYVVFILVWWLDSKSKILTVTLLILMVLLMIHLNIRRFTGTVLFNAAFFLTGSLISRCQSSQTRDPWLGSIWSAAFVAAFVFAFLLFPQVYASLFDRAPPQEIWHDPLYLIVTSACLITTMYSRAASIILGNSFMSYVGKISYSIYLLHMPVILSLDRFTALRRIPEIFLMVAFGLVIAIAGFTHKYFEMPAQRYLNRLLASKNPSFFHNLGTRLLASK